MIRDATFGALLALAAVLALVGPPRLIGTGCSNAVNPFGVVLAQEESDMPLCRSIRPIWSN